MHFFFYLKLLNVDKVDQSLLNLSNKTDRWFDSNLLFVIPYIIKYTFITTGLTYGMKNLYNPFSTEYDMKCIAITILHKRMKPMYAYRYT